METKQMSLADLNVVFGKEEKPLLEHVEDIVLPALKSGIKREVKKNTRFVFLNVELKEIAMNKYAICGIIIKDTILDVNSTYSDEKGLVSEDLHISSAPYSLFILYLENHKMALVKNQSGSPTVQNFGATFRDILVQYIKTENKERRAQGRTLLPHCIASITGIKTKESISEVMKKVKKVNEIKFKLVPLNAQWDGAPAFGILDKDFRKVLQCDSGDMVFRNPQNKQGIIDIADNIEGYAKMQMRVEMQPDSLINGKSKVRIKDNELSENTGIDIKKELLKAVDEVHAYCESKPSMKRVTNNQIMEYEEFLRRRKK